MRPQDGPLRDDIARPRAVPVGLTCRYESDIARLDAMFGVGRRHDPGACGDEDRLLRIVHMQLGSTAVAERHLGEAELATLRADGRPILVLADEERATAWYAFGFARAFDDHAAVCALRTRSSLYARPVSGTARIVVVEDDMSVAELVTLYLRNAGFIVEHAPTGARARALFDEMRPALVVLDLGLPDADGLDLLKELRAKGDTPVVALTARAEDMQRIAGLDAGMDDYMTKPFNPRELVSRVRAVLRRASGMPGGGHVLAVGNVSLDPARHEVRVGDTVVTLRAKEFELLEAFCRQPGLVLTRDKLLEDVWGFAYPGETRTVDVHVKQLRDKLVGADAKIETVWGVGYKLVPPAS